MISQALTAIADWVGRSGREKDAGRRAAWAAILMPFDDLRRAMDYLASKGAEARGEIPTSTCAMVVVRYFALLGCRCSEHQKAYIPRAGQAVIDVERIARRHGAWLTSRADLATFPADGDVVCLRQSNPHVEIVTGTNAATGAVRALAGGQGDNTGTEMRERLLRAPDGEQPFLENTDDGVCLPVDIGKQLPLYARVDTAQIVATLDRCR